MRRWLVAAVWAAWFALAGAAGQARTTRDDRVRDRGTRAWADAVTSATLVGAVTSARALPRAGIHGDPRWPLAVGAALAALGVGLRRWAAGTLGRFFTQSVAIRPGHRVVSSGPYRFVRHPGYAGLLVSQVGLGLTLGSWASVLVMVIGFFAAHLPRIAVEERVLEENLGAPYRAYEGMHRRLIPGVW